MKKFIGGRWFSWDEDKAKLNWQKHGLRFETAAKVFQDENHLTIPDEKHSQEEECFATIGRVHKVLFVVHTQQYDYEGEYTRLISARIATPEEVKYYGNRALLFS